MEVDGLDRELARLVEVRKTKETLLLERKTNKMNKEGKYYCLFIYSLKQKEQ